MKRIIRNLFLRNWELKLISLLLALVLWLSLIPEEKTLSEKTLTISLEPHNIPASMELVRKPPTTIDVVIRAPNRIIDQITSANVVAKLNLEKATVIQEEYPLYETMISVPSGAEVIKVTPNKVRLKLENTREVMLDVEPNIIGKLAEGLKIEKIEVSPPSVKVTGAESKIRDRDKVRTSPVDISNLTETTEFQADLILPNPDLRLVSSPTKVKIKIIIQGKVPEE